MLISLSNGDHDKDATDQCLEGIDGFWGYLLFSVETQSTIGYGKRIITNNCPEAVFTLCVQMIFGFGLCGALVSIVYAKMIRPHKFSPRTSFSRYAVVSSFAECEGGCRHGTLVSYYCLIIKKNNFLTYLKIVLITNYSSQNSVAFLLHLEWQNPYSFISFTLGYAASVKFFKTG